MFGILCEALQREDELFPENRLKSARRLDTYAIIWLGCSKEKSLNNF